MARTPEPPQVERSVELPIEPDATWELLVDDDERAGWFGGPTTLTAVPGAPATFTDPDGARHAGRVDAVEEGRELSWTWWPDDGDAGDASHVVIRLVPCPAGTRVTVTETQLSSAPTARRGSVARAGARLLDLELLALLRSSARMHA